MSRYLITIVLLAVVVVCAATQANASEDDLLSICDRVKEIKVIPFKGEHVEDEAYNEIVNQGAEIVHCLIEKITDTTVMEDPRKAPKHDVVVGDVAWFVINNIIDIPWDEVLPVSVMKEYESRGVYAYFSYVNDLENRMAFQKNVADWYERYKDKSKVKMDSRFRHAGMTTFKSKTERRILHFVQNDIR